MPRATKVLFSLHGDLVLISSQEDEDRFLQRLIYNLHEEDVVVDPAHEEEQVDEGGPSNLWGNVIILDDSEDEGIPMEDIEVVYKEGHVVPPVGDVPAVNLGNEEDVDIDLGLDDLEGPLEGGFIDDLIPIERILDGEPLEDFDDDSHIDWDGVPVEDWPEEDPEGDVPVDADEIAMEDMDEPEVEEPNMEQVEEPGEVAPDQSIEEMMWEAMTDAEAANALAQQYATALASE